MLNFYTEITFVNSLQSLSLLPTSMVFSAPHSAQLES